MGKEKSKKRKEDIVRALMEVMSERGYERASIAEIAKKANLRSGLIHYYFSSKLEILLMLVEFLAKELKERYQLKVESSEDSAESRVYAFIDAYVEISEGSSIEAVACWVTIGAEALHLREVRETYIRGVRKALEQLKLDLVEWLVSEGRKTDNVHLLAAGIMSAIEGAYKLAIISSDLVPAGFASPTIKQMTKGLIEAQPFLKPQANT